MILDDLLFAIPSFVMSLFYLPALIIDYIWQNFIVSLYSAVYAVAGVAVVFANMLTSFMAFVAWLPAPILALIGLYITTFVVLVIARIVLKIIATIWPGRGWLE